MLSYIEDFKYLEHTGRCDDIRLIFILITVVSCWPVFSHWCSIIMNTSLISTSQLRQSGVMHLIFGEKKLIYCQTNVVWSNSSECGIPRSEPVWRVDRLATLERQDCVFCYLFCSLLVLLWTRFQNACLVGISREKPFLCRLLHCFRNPWWCHCFDAHLLFLSFQCIRSRTICLRVKRKTSCKLGKYRLLYISHS